MKLALVKGATSQTVLIFIQDSTSTTGAGKTGLVFNTASLVAYYARPRAAAVAITLATQTVTGAFSSGGFVEVDATNMPGVYRLDPPDAALATGVDSVVIMLKGATGMAPLPLEVQLTSMDLNNATTGGLANLDAAITTRLAPTTAGRTLDVTATGEAGIDWANIGGPMTTQNLSGTSTKAVEPTVAGRTLDVSATGEAGLDWANIGSPTTAQNLSATNIDVDQIVASVSGAVGSVTGLTASNLDATVSSRATPAQVNTEVLDVLNVDTFAEPGQEAPPATTTLVKKIGYLYKFLRNRITQTATTLSIYADDATTVDQKSTVSDNGTTYDRGEIATGP